MNLRKDVLEKGVVISSDGAIREYKRGEKLKEGELFCVFSESELRSETKIDGLRNLTHHEAIVITKTLEQAMMEAILTHFYSLCCFRGKTWPEMT
ncbi:MAG: hypothetical protein ACOZAL_00390 [Patescibacteria group bacterium]